MKVKGHSFLFLIAFLWLAPGCAKYPSISFEKKIHNFGEVFQESVYTHKFKFHNRGGETLKIEKLESG